MKKIASIHKNAKKFIFLFVSMLAGIYSFAQDNTANPPETRKHIVWAYDGILPYISYAVFGILILSMAFVVVRTWWENRHDNNITHSTNS